MVKQGMNAIDEKKDQQIELALATCLEDFSLRIKSQGFLTYYETTVSAGVREFNVTGQSIDLKYIFAIQMGTGEYKRVLEYREPQIFLREHDSDTASANKPEIFTVVNSYAGFPVIRFNCPTDAAETLKVYYHTIITKDNLSAAKNVAAIVIGTQAFFYGTATGAEYNPKTGAQIRPSGRVLFEQYKEEAVLAKAADRHMPYNAKEMNLSGDDRMIMKIKKNIMRRRS